MKAAGAVKFGMRASLAAGVLCAAAIANGQTAATPAPQSSAPPAHPARVRVKLDGFDLAPQANRGTLAPSKHTGANQIGGASRGIGGVKLYAPDKGLAYSLHPTFQWSGSASAKYKITIEDLAEQTSFETTVEGTTFTYPESATALKPGTTYSWKVQPEVEIMGAPSDPALIVIAGGVERDKIEDALAAIPQTGEENARAQAKIFFDDRLWYDAAHQYSVLIAAHPSDAELHRLRGTLYDQVAATEKLADADFVLGAAK
jgi:Domain of Unknown Function (DUF928)